MRAGAGIVIGVGVDVIEIDRGGRAIERATTLGAGGVHPSMSRSATHAVAVVVRA